MSLDKRSLLKTRMQELFFKKKDAIKARIAEKRRQVPAVLTFEKKCMLIRQGKAKLRPFAELREFTNLDDAHIFQHDEDIAQLNNEIDQAEQRLSARLKEDHVKILDHVYFDKIEDALALIEKFSAIDPLRGD